MMPNWFSNPLFPFFSNYEVVVSFNVTVSKYGMRNLLAYNFGRVLIDN